MDVNMNTTLNIIKAQLNNISAEEQYKILYELTHEVCNLNNWGDPFSYARSKEIYMAIELGHTIADTYSGEDAYIMDENNQKVKFEYKSTIEDRIKGTYNGISVKSTLEEQIEYIKNEKIGCYPVHYYSRFDGGTIVETWSVPGDKVLDVLLPKIEKQYNSKKLKNSADPRIGVNMSMTDIKKYGDRIK